MRKETVHRTYGYFARFLRACARAVLFFWDTSQIEEYEGACVYVVHHRNMSGPVHSLIFLPDMPRPWILHVFLEKESCFQQYSQYTFVKRFGWPALPARAAARILSWIVPPMLRSFGAIPVYREWRQTRKTLDETVEALRRGESVVLCPDVEYASSQAATGKIYKGFLRLDELYYEQTGGHLRFVPVFCSHNKRIVTGEAVYNAKEMNARAAREDMARRLVESLNNLAAACEGDLEQTDPRLSEEGSSASQAR